MKKFFLFFFPIWSIFLCGEITDPFAPRTSTDERHFAIIDYFQGQKWKKLIAESKRLIQEHPNSPFSKEALYYLGVGYFQMEDYEFANEYFSRYLKEEISPKFFDEAIRFKFEIAQKFEQGAKRHIFGWEKMPSWLPAYSAAVEIYDEVITTMPRDELAAQSLYRKGVLLLRLDRYQKSVDSFQTLIRRFPKHPLAIECYLGISEAYLIRCKKEFPDSDLLDLAEINLRKFRTHFPGEPRIEVAEKMLLDMKEILAKDFFEMGCFYERTKKKKAASLYYTSIMKKYPHTKVAVEANRRLKKLDLPPEEENKAKKEIDKETITVEADDATDDLSSSPAQ